MYYLSEAEAGRPPTPRSRAWSCAPTDQPGPAAAGGPDRDRREGGEALPVDHRLSRVRIRSARSPRASARPEGRGCSCPEGDNLESHYARDALRQLYVMLVGGRVVGCTLAEFEDATGLKLTDSNGIKDDLPPITTFLNRLLALTIGHQNILFTVFEQLMAARRRGAIASGVSMISGLETLTVEEALSFSIAGVIHRHPATAQRRDPLSRPIARKLLQPLRSVSATPLPCWRRPRGHVAGQRPGRAALPRKLLCPPGLLLPAPAMERRTTYLVRPMERRPHGSRPALPRDASGRRPTGRAFSRIWAAEVEAVPEFVTDRVHIVTGLLLLDTGGACPMEKVDPRLPASDRRLRRAHQWAPGVHRLGRQGSLARTAPGISPDAAFAGLDDGRDLPDLADGLHLGAASASWAPTASSSPVSARRGDQRPRPMAFSNQIIACKLCNVRVFTDGHGPAVLETLLRRHPVTRRMAAA